MPLLLFLAAVSWRWTWPMPFRGLIQFSNMSQSWFFRQKLTQASVKFTNLQSRTQTQNEICKKIRPKYFHANVKSAAWKKNISKRACLPDEYGQLSQDTIDRNLLETSQTDPCLNFHYRKGELVLALKRLARGCFNIEKCSCARLFIGDPCETIL